MKNKKSIFLIFIILVGILSFFSFKHYALKVKDTHCLTTQISSRLFDFNSFNLEVDNHLDILDFKIVNLNSGKTIYENGKSKKGIANDYGYCSFKLYWKNNYIYEFGHYKHNNWHTNDYTLSLRLIDNKIIAELNIIGPDSNKANFYIK